MDGEKAGDKIEENSNEIQKMWSEIIGKPNNMKTNLIYFESVKKLKDTLSIMVAYTEKFSSTCGTMR